MKILTRAQARERGYAIDEGACSVGYKDIGSHMVEAEIMTEREEELVEALRTLIHGFEEVCAYLPDDEELHETDRDALIAYQTAHKLLEKYDA